MIIVGFIWNVGIIFFLSIFFEVLWVRRGWYGGIISGCFGIVWIVCCLGLRFLLLMFLFFIFFIIVDLIFEFIFLLILLFSDNEGFIICCGEIECVLSLGLWSGESFLIYFVVIFCFILGGVGMCLWSLLIVYCRGI